MGRDGHYPLGLVFPDFSQKSQKSLFGHFCQCRQKTIRKTFGAPPNVEKPSKHLPPEGFLKVFEGFGTQKETKGVRALGQFIHSSTFERNEIFQR